MGDTSGRNFSMYNHTLSKEYCDSEHGDVSSGYGFKNSHTLSQCIDLITFKNIDEDNEKDDGDMISGYFS